MPVACYRPANSILTVIAQKLPLPGSDIQPSIILTIGDARIALFCNSDHGVPANVAYAHHDSNRNVPDEWVCNCQGAYPFPISRETVERITLSCVSPLRACFFRLIPKFF